MTSEPAPAAGRSPLNAEVVHRVDDSGHAGGADVVAHGVTVAELDRIAGKAAYQSRWRYLPYAERIDLARYAICE